MAPTSRRSLLASFAALPAVAAGAAPTFSSDSDAELSAAIARYHEADGASIRLEEAAQAAYERYLDEFGGKPDFPDAVWVREDDRTLGIYSSTRCPLSDRYFYSETAIGYHRRNPCRRGVTQKRPATIDDGFTAAEVASGDHSIGKTEIVPWPEAQVRADEIVAAWDAFQAEEQRRRDDSGSTAAEERHDAAMEAYRAARDTMVLTPARTMQGVLAKAAVVMGIYADPEGMGDFEDALTRENETFDLRLSLSLARDLHKLAGEV